MADDQPMGGYSEGISQLSNIARNLALWAQSQVNAYPVPTSTVSPKFTAVTLGTAAITALISTSSLRHGIIFHNPGTATCYIFQTGMSSAPTTTSLGGAIVIYPGGTFSIPSSVFVNVNAGFSGFSGTGSNQPFTVVEFF